MTVKTLCSGLALLSLLTFAAAPAAFAQAKKPAAKPKANAADAWQEIYPGVLRWQGRFRSSATSDKIWVYLPKNAPAGKLPVVLMSTSNGELFFGGTLSKEEEIFQAPYALAGYAVVAYDLSGPVKDTKNHEAVKASITSFQNAEWGVTDGKMALDYALKFIPNLDKSRVFAVGVGTGSTVALQLAAKDARIRGCVAYSPVVNVPRESRHNMTYVREKMPQAAAHAEAASPHKNPHTLRCPLFMFYAKDDDSIFTQEADSYAKAVKQYNPKVTLTTVPTGGNFDAMLDAGILQAVKWMAKQ